MKSATIAFLIIGFLISLAFAIFVGKTHINWHSNGVCILEIERPIPAILCFLMMVCCVIDQAGLMNLPLKITF